jgi:D-alanine-D-alanine ligase
MNITVIFDEAILHDDAAPDIRAALPCIESIESVLRHLGHAVERVSVSRSTQWTEKLLSTQPHVVFNLCEGVEGDAGLEAAVADTIELFGLPLTGCSAATLALARRKDRVNTLLASAGLRVPVWTNGVDAAAWDRFPAIVKPAGEDASVGIDQSSIVCTSDELIEAIERMRRHGPLIVQEYIDGREINAGILAGRTLPLAEIEFAMPAGTWPIVSYDAKWSAGSDEDLGSVQRCPADVDDHLAIVIEHAARTAWTVLGCRGYARFDFRIDANGTAWILEVNPNPDLSTDAGFARMTAADGMDRATVISKILEEAMA